MTTPTKSWAEERAEEYCLGDTSGMHANHIVFKMADSSNVQKSRAFLAGVRAVVEWAGAMAVWEGDGPNQEDYQVVNLEEIKALLERKEGKEAE